MPLLIQRSPVGLLGILDSKQSGMAPAALLDEVRAIYDVGSLYSNRVRRSRSSSILVANNVLGVNVSDPVASDHMYVRDGEIWLVWAIAAQLSTVSGTCNGTAGFVAGGQFYMCGTVTTGAPATFAGADGGLLNGLILNPGDTPAFFFRNYAVGVTECDIQLTVLFDLVKT